MYHKTETMGGDGGSMYDEARYRDTTTPSPIYHICIYIYKYNYVNVDIDYVYYRLGILVTAVDPLVTKVRPVPSCAAARTCTVGVRRGGVCANLGNVFDPPLHG